MPSLQTNLPVWKLWTLFSKVQICLYKPTKTKDFRASNSPHTISVNKSLWNLCTSTYIILPPHPPPPPRPRPSTIGPMGAVQGKEWNKHAKISFLDQIHQRVNSIWEKRTLSLSPPPHAVSPPRSRINAFATVMGFIFNLEDNNTTTRWNMKLTFCH